MLLEEDCKRIVNILEEDCKRIISLPRCGHFYWRSCVGALRSHNCCSRHKTDFHTWGEVVRAAAVLRLWVLRMKRRNLVIFWRPLVLTLIVALALAVWLQFDSQVGVERNRNQNFVQESKFLFSFSKTTGNTGIPVTTVRKKATRTSFHFHFKLF